METYVRNRRCPCMRCMSYDVMGAAVLVTLGTLFLIDRLSTLDFRETFPLLLIVIGLVMIARSNAPTTGHVQPQLPHSYAPPVTQSAVQESTNV